MVTHGAAARNGTRVARIAITLTGVPRPAKTTQTALDELDKPCPVSSIDEHFMPRAQIVLGRISGACYDSIAHVALALAGGKGEIPTGNGAACVRHFSKRSKQLKQAAQIPVDQRFALIELAMLAGISGRWTEPAPIRRTLAKYKEVSGVVATLNDTHGANLEHWRRLVKFHWDSPRTSASTFRNIAYALVWCGYFAPHEREITDKRLATEWFGTKREEFVNKRVEALRTLANLLEFSQQNLPGGPL